MSITITSAANYGTSITVTWNALGGSPTYSVSLSPTGGTSTITTTNTTATFTGFTKGLQYTVTVQSGANSGSQLLDDPNYGMCLWLDVADSSTLTFSGFRRIGNSTVGRIVSAIADKSGQGKNATTTAGFDNPVYVPSVDTSTVNNADYLAYAPTNGTSYRVQSTFPYPALLFRGVSNPDAPGTPDSLNATIAQPASGTPFAMFAVMKSLAAQSFWGSGDDGDTLINYDQYYNVTAFHGATIIDQRISANLMTNYNFVLQGVYNSTSGGTKYINTKLNGTTTGTNTVGTYYHVNNWRICGRQNWSATGYFSEVIIYNRLLTDNEVNMIEGYLATKYGMRSLLPVAHPYYSVPYPDRFATSAGISGGGVKAITAANWGNSIQVSWNPITSTSQYAVALSPAGGTVSTTTTSTTVTFTGFTKGQQYTAYVTDGTTSGVQVVDDPNYGMCLWIDVADATTLTYGAGRTIGTGNYSTVTAIAEKSGLGRTVTVSSGFNAPVIVSNVDVNLVNTSAFSNYNIMGDGSNYRVTQSIIQPALSFRGYYNSSKDSMNVTINQPNTGTPFSMFNFYKPITGGCFFGSLDSPNTLINYSAYLNNTYFRNTILMDERNANTTVTNYGYIIQSLYNSSNSVNGIQYNAKLNGNQVTTTSPGAFYNTSNIVLCGRTNGERQHAYLHETIIYNRLLNVNEINMIEGYLATKYNYQSALPAGHPYKTTAYPGTIATTAGSSGGGTPPVVISPYIRAIKNDSSNGHTFMLKTNGEAYGVGANDFGQLGVGDTTTRTSPTKANVPKGVAQVATGEKTTLFVAKDGTVYAAGKNTSGQCGVGNTSSPVTSPTQLVGLTGKLVTDAAAGTNHGAVVCSDGTLYTFGDNTFGQLGRSGAGTSTPTLVTLANSKLAYSVVCVKNSTVVLCTDGTLQAFGYNGNNELGDGSATNRTTPVVIATTLNKPVAALFGGNSFCAALCQDNSIQTWGLNTNGATGSGQYGTNVSIPTPVAMPAGKTVANIALSNQTGYIVFTDGSVYGFGYQANSALAGTTGTYIVNPVALSLSVDSKTIKNVTATIDSCFAIVDDGTVYVWGLNTAGSFGTGSTSPATSATPVLTLFTSISTSVIPLETVVNPPSISIRPFVESQAITYYWGFDDPSTISSVTLSCIGPGGGVAQLDSNARFYTFSNLTNGADYAGAIVGSDSGGIASVSSLYRVVQPGSLPQPSQNVVFTKVGSSIQVDWTAPLSPNAEVKWYVLSSTDESYTFGIEFYKNTFTSSAISAGTYTWVLRAVNDIGYGTAVYSSPITFT